MLRRNFMKSVPLLSLIPLSVGKEENPRGLPVIEFKGGEIQSPTLNNPVNKKNSPISIQNLDYLFKLSNPVKTFDDFLLYQNGTKELSQNDIETFKSMYSFFKCEDLSKLFTVNAWTSELIIDEDCGYLLTGEVFVSLYSFGEINNQNIFDCIINPGSIIKSVISNKFITNYEQ